MIHRQGSRIVMEHQDIPAFVDYMAGAGDVTIVTWGQLSRLARMLITRSMAKMDKALPGLDKALRPCCFPLFGRYFVILNFEPGCPNVSVDFQSKTVVHEVGHAFNVRAYIKKGKGTAPNWLANYLFNEEFRGMAEGFPNTAEGEFGFFMTGKYETPVCDYGAYLIDNASAMSVFRGGCEFRREWVMKRGSLHATQESARIAIDYIEQHVR